MRTHSSRLSTLGRGAVLVLAGVLVAGTAAAVPAGATTTGIDGNSITLAVTPAVPDVNAVFQVRATGNVNASQSNNVYLSVTLAPADVACYPTSALEQARAEQYPRDPRWGHWGRAYVGGNSPDNAAYLEEQVFAGRPAGAYRLCGYLRGQGQAPDPYVMERIDFTIGGTCAEAGASLAAAQQARTAADVAVDKAAAKVVKKKKAFTKAKKVLKKKKGSAGSKAVAKAKKKVKRTKAAWKKSKAALTTRRAQAQEAATALAAAQERYGYFC